MTYATKSVGLFVTVLLVSIVGQAQLRTFHPAFGELLYKRKG